MATVVPDSLEKPVTAGEAADIAGVSVATIRSWVHRGHLAASGETDKGHPTYRLIDVAKAERATREKARRFYPQAG